MWQRDISVGCPNVDEDSVIITSSSTSYEIEEDSRYNISVTASDSADITVVINTVTVMTLETGEREPLLVLVFRDI